MRIFGSAFLLAVAAVIVLVGFDRAGGQQSKVESPETEPARERIVPVVLLKPGERKDLLLSTKCTVGATRSGGFDVREIEGDAAHAALSAKVWKQNGVMVEVPDFETGLKQSALPQYELLKKAGVNVFSVSVAASEDAQPGAYNLHLADFTCNGTCATDFRVLVVAP